MIKAKAAVLKGLGDWAYDEIDIPEPNKNRAIIKILKSGICSTDVVRSMVFGFYSYPIVPGHEMLGYVYKLGSKVNGLKEGDKVCVYPLITKCTDESCCGGTHSVYGVTKAPNLCSDYDFLGSRSHGGYAEYVSSPINNLVKVPKNLDDNLAVFTEPASVALHAFKLARQDRKFDSVVISGLGPIGILLASWCKVNKIENVIGIDRNENRFKNFKDLGFKNIIDTSKDNFIEKVSFNFPSGLKSALVISDKYNSKLLLAKLDYKISEKNVNIEKSKFSPSASVNYTKSQNKDYSSTVDQIDQETLKATVTIPIFKGGENYSSLKKSQFKKEQTNLILQDVINEVKTDTANAWSTYQSSESVLKSTKAQVKAAEIANEGISLEYDSGNTRTTLEVIQSRSLLLNARISNAEAERNFAVSKFELMAVIGDLSLDNLKKF